MTDFTNVVVIVEHGEELLARAAFGRMFIEGNDEWDKRCEYLNTTPRGYILNHLHLPDGVKIFVDD